MNKTKSDKIDDVFLFFHTRNFSSFHHFFLYFSGHVSWTAYNLSRIQLVFSPFLGPNYFSSSWWRNLLQWFNVHLSSGGGSTFTLSTGVGNYQSCNCISHRFKTISGEDSLGIHFTFSTLGVGNFRFSRPTHRVCALPILLHTHCWEFRTVTILPDTSKHTKRSLPSTVVPTRSKCNISYRKGLWIFDGRSSATSFCLYKFWQYWGSRILCEHDWQSLIKFVLFTPILTTNMHMFVALFRLVSF